MSFETPSVIAPSYSGLDGTVISAQYFFTSDEQTFVPTSVNIGAQVVAGFTSAPTISIGTNAPNYDDILSGTSLSAFNTSNTSGSLSVNSMVEEVPPGTDVYINISVGAVATTYTFRVSLEGIVYE